MSYKSYIPTEDNFKEFMDDLPHGSGIDYDWSMWESKQNYYFQNAYHIMDDMGGYVGWQDFSIVIPKKDFHNGDYVTNFSLQFNNGFSYWATMNDLRFYLEEMFNSELWDMSPCGTEQLKINFDAKWNTPEQIAARKNRFNS